MELNETKPQRIWYSEHINIYFQPTLCNSFAKKYQQENFATINLQHEGSLTAKAGCPSLFRGLCYLKLIEPFPLHFLSLVLYLAYIFFRVNFSL